MTEQAKNSARNIVNLIYTRSGKMPTPEGLASMARGITVEEAKSVIESHQVSVDEGILPEVKPEPIQGRIEAQTKENKQPVNGKFSIHDLPIEAIKVFCIVLSVIAAITGAVYIFHWFIEVDSTILGWIRSSLMCVFVPGLLLLCPQIIILIFNMNLKGKTGRTRFFSTVKSSLISFPLLIITLVIMFFSMSATLKGLYDSRTTEVKEIVEASAESEKANAQIEELNKEEDRLNEQIRLNNESISKAQAALDPDLPIPLVAGTWQYREQTILISNNKKANEAANTRLSEISKERRELRETTIETKESRADFFEWSDTVLKTGSPDVIEFWSSAALALIIDFVAPIVMAFGLFLRRKE